MLYGREDVIACSTGDAADSRSELPRDLKCNRGSAYGESITIVEKDHIVDRVR